MHGELLFGIQPAEEAAWSGAAPLRSSHADAILLNVAVSLLEYLARAVITVMLASGRALEARASSGAQHALHALLAHAPRVDRYEHGELTSRPIDDVMRGDLLLV